MPQMTISGSIDPLLSVVLEKGEAIFAERNAMVSMDSTLALTGRAKGGIFSALSRKFLNDESFFQQKIEAVDGAGEVLLTPTLPGNVCILTCGEHQYMISDGAYLASTETVELETKSQGLGRALLGDSGGFFVMSTEGHGQIAVSGFGKGLQALDFNHSIGWAGLVDHADSLSSSFLNHQNGFGLTFCLSNRRFPLSLCPKNLRLLFCLGFPNGSLPYPKSITKLLNGQKPG